MGNELTVVNSNLPSTMEDLTRFVLVERERLVAVRAEIRAIDKLGLVQGVREQKLREAQSISETVLDAEVRIGELMNAVPKATAKNNPSGKSKTQIDTAVELGTQNLEDVYDFDDALEPEQQTNEWDFLEEEPAKEEKPKTKAEIVKETGFSQKQVERFQMLAAHPDIVAKAKAEARENDDIVSRSLVLNMVKEQKRAEKEATREEQRQENAEKIEELATPLEAQGLFQTIVIDPPWDWGDEGDVNQFGRAKPDYHTMPIEEIEQLPVGQIADQNCHLYLWVTNRSLPKAFRLIEAWGFRYITCLTWVKPSIGMGNYFRGSTEQVLFAVKGSQPLKRKDVGTHFEAPRGKGHSAKPDEFYDLVESCSYAPYIDIFGRKEKDGWSVWGENG